MALFYQKTGGQGSRIASNSESQDNKSSVAISHMDKSPTEVGLHKSSTVVNSVLRLSSNSSHEEDDNMVGIISTASSSTDRVAGFNTRGRGAVDFVNF